MKLVAKSSKELKQLNDRKERGFKHIELQLIEDFMNEDINVDEYIKDILSDDWTIETVHMPLVPDDIEINVEYLTYPKYRKIFSNCCRLSQKLAEYYNQDISIVIHAGISLELLKRMPILLESIVEVFNDEISKNPNITFSIENFLPFCVNKKGITLTTFCYFENVELAKYLNKVCNKKVFYTTLDICHMLSTIGTLELFQDIKECHKFIVEIEDFFKNNKTVINNIHLNNIRHLGVGKGKHGVSFDSNNVEDMHLLEYILDLYNKYEYKCNLVLEVIEDCYDLAILAEDLKHIIEEKKYEVYG